MCSLSAGADPRAMLPRVSFALDANFPIHYRSTSCSMSHTGAISHMCVRKPSAELRRLASTAVEFKSQQHVG